MQATHSFYFGLDFDGIFCPDRFKSPMDVLTAKKVAELFQPDGSGNYTPLQWKQAAAYFLNETAIGIFKTHVIERIEAFVKQHNLPVSVGLIITSNWRNSATLDELKTYVFNRTGFADKIVAKIPDDEKGVPKVARHILFVDTVKAQPNSVAGYVALDDNEFGKEAHYPDEMEEFVKVNGEKLLTIEDADRAFAKAEKQLRSKFEIKYI
jgi:hypothetical protein